MNKYFYHVIITDDYYGDIKEDWGFFTSLENAYKVCAERNEELENDFSDFEDIKSDICKWGNADCGVFTIICKEFEDVD